MPKEETKERKSSVDGKSAEGKEKKEGKGKFTKTAAAANNVRCRSFDTLNMYKMQNIPFSTDKQCSHDVQEKGEEPAEGSKIQSSHIADTWPSKEQIEESNENGREVNVRQ